MTGISLIPETVIFSGKITKQPLQLIAKCSDGTSRPVNQLGLYLTNNKATADINDNGLVTAGKRGDTFVFARFAKYTAGSASIVLPQDKHFKWPKIPEVNYIDATVDTKLQQLRILPSGIAPDEEFVRRVYFDLIGLPPTPEEFRSFVASKDRDKRAKLVDTLLTPDEFNDLWATKWSEMLKIVSDNNSSYGTDRKAAFDYYEWIREQVKKNTPLDQFARMQIASKGSNLQDPAVNLYTMLPQGQYDAKAVAQDVTQIFTGMRI